MKYLKTYKIFENTYEKVSDEFRGEVNDYLAGLRDSGYRTSVASYPGQDGVELYVIVRKGTTNFRWLETKDDVKRLIEMTNNKMTGIVCHDESRNVQVHFSSVNEIPHETEMTFLQIYFDYMGSISESDSWAGSLYAYDKRVVPVETDSVIVPRKMYSLNCNDCGVVFDSFIIDGPCKNCGSENTGPVNINPV